MDAIHVDGDGGRTYGGMKGAHAIREAAMLCALGLDGTRLLTTSDPTEALMLQAVGQEATSILRQRDKSLAAEIANAVGRLFK